jgi:hypothetical protein
MVACSAMAAAKEQEQSGENASPKSKWAKWKRGGIIGAAALTGGALLAITGGRKELYGNYVGTLKILSSFCCTHYSRWLIFSIAHNRFSCSSNCCWIWCSCSNARHTYACYRSQWIRCYGYCCRICCWLCGSGCIIWGYV